MRCSGRRPRTRRSGAATRTRSSLTDPRRCGFLARWALALLGVLGLVVSCPVAVAAVTEIAITVDDLPTHGVLPPGTTRLTVAATMIDALRRHAVPGVYGFVNGGQV